MPHLMRPAYEPSADYTAAKRKAGLCQNYRCPNRHGKATGGRCYKHHWQHKKRKDPIAYIFYHKRQRARERGKRQPWGKVPGWEPWTLTLDNFRDWCLATGYHLKTGRKHSSMTLDRKDNRFGYHVWNLAPLSLGANSAKGNRERSPGCYIDSDPDGTLVSVTIHPDGSQTREPLF